MKQLKLLLLIVCSTMFTAHATIALKQSTKTPTETIKQEALNILWTTDNANTAINFIAMYSGYANKKAAFSKVNVIIWGGANELIGENEDVQQAISKMLKAGITIKACRACADKMGTTKILEELGVQVDYMGNELTKIIKEKQHLLTI